MPLESGTTIADLNPAWPLGSDQKAQGDDHLRLIKAVVQGDVASLANGGVFATPPTVPSGSTGLQVVNAGDVPGLAGTGPVEIVGADATAGWQVWGDVLIQWGTETPAATQHVITFAQAFEVAPAVTANGVVGGSIATLTAISTTGATIDVSASSEVTWIAVGEAPEALKKPKTVTAAGAMQYHDPTGAASWRIVGSTLECWGVTGFVTGGGLQIAFPKTFRYPPSAQANVKLQNPDATYQYVVTVGETTVSNMTIWERFQDGTTGVIAEQPCWWYAIGEWDGVTS